MRLWAALGLGVLAACPAQQPPATHVEAPSLPAEEARLHAAVDTLVADGFSGGVLVARADTLLVDAAISPPGAPPLGGEARFILSSMAKQFVATAILRLWEQGRLQLDDGVGRFFAEVPEDKAKITVRQLLSHQSGFGQTYVAEEAATSGEGARRILEQALVDEPGAGFHYSNANYELLVAIVESVTGRPYRAHLLDEILSGVGLKDTGFCDATSSTTLVPARDPLPERLRRPHWGGGGMYSTRHDLLLWVRAVRAGRVLGPEGVSALFSPVVPIREGHAGLGWYIGSTDGGVTRYFVRGNDDFGANSLIYVYPSEDVVVIVLTHGGDRADGRSWSRAMLSALEQVLFPEG